MSVSTAGMDPAEAWGITTKLAGKASLCARFPAAIRVDGYKAAFRAVSGRG